MIITSAAAPQVRSARKAPEKQAEGYSVEGRFPSKRWAWIERLHDPDPHFTQHEFTSRQVQRDPEVVKAFGSNAPHSGNVLLHYAGDPPAGVKKQPNPVILVHGANKDGNFFWDPSEDGSDKGLAQRLKSEGFQVYAVTFALNQDDNYVQEEQLANCIDRVKNLTGADKVDLLGHSKGGMPVRMYASNFHESWMTPYRGDVNKMVLVATPNGGIDNSFRHPSSNYALVAPSDNPLLNAPMSWEHITLFGVPVNKKDDGFDKDGADHFPGQRQILARWDSKYPIDVFENDFFTYNGGMSIQGTSKGIDYFIKQGGNLIERLGETPVAPGVEVDLLAGNNPNIPGILNEYTGPSDGLLFVDSALQMPKGTEVAHQTILPLNHKSLISDASGQEWIADVLTGRDPAEPAEKEVVHQHRPSALAKVASAPDPIEATSASPAFLAMF